MSLLKIVSHQLKPQRNWLKNVFIKNLRISRWMANTEKFVRLFKDRWDVTSPTLVVMHLSMLSRGGGRAWGGDLTFFKNLSSNSLPTGKSFQSIATKFRHPGLHIVVYPKAGPKKGTIKISPNKTLQSFINVAASPLSLIHIWRCRRIERCRSRWSPYH